MFETFGLCASNRLLEENSAFCEEFCCLLIFVTNPVLSLDIGKLLYKECGGLDKENKRSGNNRFSHKKTIFANETSIML